MQVFDVRCLLSWALKGIVCLFAYTCYRLSEWFWTKNRIQHGQRQYLAHAPSPMERINLMERLFQNGGNKLRLVFSRYSWMTRVECFAASLSRVPPENNSDCDGGKVLAGAVEDTVFVELNLCLGKRATILKPMRQAATRLMATEWH